MSIVTTDDFNLGTLANLTDSGGVLDGARIGLFTAGPTLNNSTTLADLTEANYTGYARQALTFFSVYQQPDGSMALQGNLAEFKASDSVTPNTIIGYFVCDNNISSTSLLFAELLPESVGIANDLDALLISPQVSFGNATDYGAATVIE